MSTTIDPGEVSLGHLMVEAEELMLQLNDRRTWHGRMPSCRSITGVHRWQPRLQARIEWRHASGATQSVAYPVAVCCQVCEWVIPIHGDDDPLEAVASTQGRWQPTYRR